jgi:hypothetical protein
MNAPANVLGYLKHADARRINSQDFAALSIR